MNMTTEAMIDYKWGPQFYAENVAIFHDLPPLR